MTLLQEIETLKKQYNGNAASYDRCIAKVRAFADKLEWEEMVERVALEIDRIIAREVITGEKVAKNTLAVVIEQIKGE